MSDSEKTEPNVSPASLNSLDLRLLPSWLKEENSAPPNYANFDGEDAPARRERRDGGRDFRPGGRPQAGGGNARGGQRPAPGSRPAREANGRPPRRDGRGPEAGGARRPEFSRSSEPGRRPERVRPLEERAAKVSISFLPERRALEKVTELLKSAPIAYPLFGVAKMFLERPERHLVRIAPLPETKLYKLQNTAHLSTERGRLEAMAFGELWQQFFRRETESAEIKGNFTSVARSKLTGKVLGPTSHHSFQPALHKEYEERFSRRMSFQEYRSNIETTNNPEAVEQWKTESRRVESYHLLTEAEKDAAAAPPPAEPESVAEAQTPAAETATTEAEAAAGAGISTETVVDTTELSVELPAETLATEAAEPAMEMPSGEPVAEDTPAELSAGAAPETPAVSSGLVFASRGEAETYFRNEILPGLIVETDSETLTGPEARALADRQIGAAVRQAWEAEVRYPLGLVNGIRVKFNEQNLHIFKFKKRVLLISSLKPFFLDDKSGSLSTSIRTVLQTIVAQPGIHRKGLAEKILGHHAAESEDEKLSLKHSLIGDLYWLVRQGHVIEFADGTFDLPMGPKAVQAEAAQEKAGPAPVSEASQTSAAPLEQ